MFVEQGLIADERAGNEHGPICDDLAALLAYPKVFRVLCLGWVVPAAWLAAVGMRAVGLGPTPAGDPTRSLERIQAVTISLLLVTVLVGLICATRPGWVASVPTAPMVALATCVAVRLTAGWLPTVSLAPALLVAEGAVLAWSAVSAFRATATDDGGQTVRRFEPVSLGRVRQLLPRPVAGR